MTIAELPFSVDPGMEEMPLFPPEFQQHSPLIDSNIIVTGELVDKSNIGAIVTTIQSDDPHFEQYRSQDYFCVHIDAHENDPSKKLSIYINRKGKILAGYDSTNTLIFTDLTDTVPECANRFVHLLLQQSVIDTQGNIYSLDPMTGFTEYKHDDTHELITANTQIVEPTKPISKDGIGQMYGFTREDSLLYIDLIEKGLKEREQNRIADVLISHPFAEGLPLERSNIMEKLKKVPEIDDSTSSAYTFIGYESIEIATNTPYSYLTFQDEYQSTFHILITADGRVYPCTYDAPTGTFYEEKDDLKMVNMLYALSQPEGRINKSLQGLLYGKNNLLYKTNILAGAEECFPEVASRSETQTLHIKNGYSDRTDYTALVEQVITTGKRGNVQFFSDERAMENFYATVRRNQEKIEVEKTIDSTIQHIREQSPFVRWTEKEIRDVKIMMLREIQDKRAARNTPVTEPTQPDIHPEQPSDIPEKSVMRIETDNIDPTRTLQDYGTSKKVILSFAFNIPKDTPWAINEFMYSLTPDTDVSSHISYEPILFYNITRMLKSGKLSTNDNFILGFKREDIPDAAIVLFPGQEGWLYGDIHKDVDGTYVLQHLDQTHPLVDSKELRHIRAAYEVIAGTLRIEPPQGKIVSKLVKIDTKYKITSQNLTYDTILHIVDAGPRLWEWEQIGKYIPEVKKILPQLKDVPDAEIILYIAPRLEAISKEFVNLPETDITNTSLGGLKKAAINEHNVLELHFDLYDPLNINQSTLLTRKKGVVHSICIAIPSDSMTVPAIYRQQPTGLKRQIGWVNYVPNAIEDSMLTESLRNSKSAGLSIPTYVEIVNEVQEQNISKAEKTGNMIILSDYTGTSLSNLIPTTATLYTAASAGKVSATKFERPGIKKEGEKKPSTYGNWIDVAKKPLLPVELTMIHTATGFAYGCMDKPKEVLPFIRDVDNEHRLYFQIQHALDEHTLLGLAKGGAKKGHFAAYFTALGFDEYPDAEDAVDKETLESWMAHFLKGGGNILKTTRKFTFDLENESDHENLAIIAMVPAKDKNYILVGLHPENKTTISREVHAGCLPHKCAVLIERFEGSERIIESGGLFIEKDEVLHQAVDAHAHDVWANNPLTRFDVDAKARAIGGERYKPAYFDGAHWLVTNKIKQEVIHEIEKLHIHYKFPSVSRFNGVERVLSGTLSSLLEVEDTAGKHWTHVIDMYTSELLNHFSPDQIKNVTVSDTFMVFGGEIVVND